MDEEQWREWPQDPRIMVSNMGNVISHKRGSGYPLKVWHTNDGYQMVGAGDAHRPSRYVHRLVAETWMPNPNQYEQVNHINGDKSDNRVENLEWASPSQNMRHAYRTGLLKAEGTPVRIVETGEIFESVSECARRIGCDHSSISNCLAGRNRTCRGYHFEYA